MNTGASNRPIYDTCAYQKRLYESTSPLAYHLYHGKYEHCNKCRQDKFWTPMALVEVESELRNQTRPLSECDQFKYSPDCKRSGICWSTFDKDVPVILAPEICPIIHNNIPKRTDNGLPNMNDSDISGNFCVRK